MHEIPVADLRGVRGTCVPGVQILTISCSFGENLPPPGLAPPPREILDPPLDTSRYLARLLFVIVMVHCV